MSHVREKNWGASWILTLILIAVAFPSGADARADRPDGNLSRAFTAETNEVFFVDPELHRSSASQVSATLRVTGEWGYFYVEDRWWNNLFLSERDGVLRTIQSLSAEFDAAIVPRMRDLYGSEWTPGIDGDPRMTILILDLKLETGGYFDSANELARAQAPASNEREMIVVSANHLTDIRAKAFLAHEYQHLISYNQKERLRGVADDVWLNEARSEYASTYLGYDSIFASGNLARRVNSFLVSPSDPLGQWKNEPADYGSVNLFVQYLVGRFGERINRDMVQSAKAGIASIEDALQVEGRTESFAAVFADWAVANFLNDSSLGERYSYTNPNLRNVRVTASGISTAGSADTVLFSAQVQSWSPRWYTVLPGGTRTMIRFIPDSKGAKFRLVSITKSVDNTYAVGEVPLVNGEASRIIPAKGGDIAAVTFLPILENRVTDFADEETPESFRIRASAVSSVLFVVESLKPNTAGTEGGSEVEIRGEGFEEGMQVFFGETPSPRVTVVDAQTLRAVVPPGKSGGTSVRVRHPSGLFQSLENQFRYDDAIPSGALIRARGDIKVYVVAGSYRRHIRSPKIFSFYGHLSFAHVLDVDPAVVARYQESSLVRASNDRRVYDIDAAGVKHWLEMSGTAFRNSGRSWEMVFLINARERDFYKTGATIVR
ncbi:MAG: IPT/TIG domain-containing protein [Parcubacteria group bacterium]|nr:IPT/TIG domain-containing protein [Parcubacteria group bacterium]